MAKSKVVPINRKDLQPKSNANGEYDFKGNAKKYDEYVRDPDQHHKIFTELGFSYHDDEEFCAACDRNGSCPEHPQDKGLYVDGRLNLEAFPPLKRIRIVADFGAIAMAMEDQNNEMESFYYLDIETGDVEFFTSDVLHAWETDESEAIDSLPGWQKDEVAVVKQIMENDKRYVAIPKLESAIGFRFMQTFVGEIKDDKIADHLIRALRQNKPFRRFKDTLAEYDRLDRWYAFKDRKLRDEVIEFLQSIHKDRIELAVPPLGRG